eukprot:15278043-Alexandrium_andersonii.AAC.1
MWGERIMYITKCTTGLGAVACSLNFAGSSLPRSSRLNARGAVSGSACSSSCPPAAPKTSALHLA